MGVAIGMSLIAVVAGYGGSRVFAWQMFPEASRWQADIVRVTADGVRHPIEGPWPGGYRWSDLVTESGLSYPAVESNAAYGVDTTMDALQHALEWVAANTPADRETVLLEASVTLRRNDSPPETVVLRAARPAAP